MFGHLFISAQILMAGFTAYAAIQHYSNQHRWSGDRLHLLFAAIALLTSLWALSFVFVFQSTSVADCLAATRTNVAIVLLLASIVPWFFADYSGIRNNSLLVGLSGQCAVLFIANLIQPYTVLYTEIHGLGELVLPWGERITYMETSPGAWTYITAGTIVIIVLWALYLLTARMRRDRRLTSPAMMFALGLFILTSAESLAVRLGLIHFSPIGPLGILGIVIVMGEMLNRELLEEHRNLQRILDHIPVHIYLKDPDGRYLLINQYFEKTFHVSSRMVIGKTDHEIFRADEANALCANDREVFASRQFLEREEIITYDGEPHIFLSTKVPLYHDHGKPFAVCGIATDITERKRMEEDLRVSEQKFSIAYRHSPDAILLIDLESGRIFEANDGIEKIYGYSREEAIGHTSLELGLCKNPLDRQNVFEIVREHRKISNMELEGRHKSGSKLFVQLSTEVVEISGKTCLVTTVRDITTREQAQRKIQDSEKRFKAVIEQAPIAISLLDMQGHPIDSNKALSRMVGYSREELSTMTFAEFTHPDDAEKDVSQFGELLAGLRSEYSMEKRYIHKNGSMVWGNLFVTMRRDENGNPEEIIGMAEDITERKKAEDKLRQSEERTRQQQLQLIQADKMASLGLLVSGIAHEINNPNNLVMFNSDLISRTVKSALPILDDYYDAHPDRLLCGLPYSKIRVGLDDLLNGLKAGAERIRDIVSTLKDLARTNSGAMYEQIQINDVVRTAISIVDNLVRKSTEKFSAEYDGAIPIVIGNFQQIEQVIINLVTNACHALTDKSQAIRVTTRYDRGEGNVIVTVSDEGVGIPPENVKHMFDPFFTTKRDIGGTGLGLSISYTIAQAHKGELRVHSTVGEGTTMSLCLPIGMKEERQ
jgi:PAS domain S-box-containing protein